MILNQIFIFVTLETHVLKIDFRMKYDTLETYLSLSYNFLKFSFLWNFSFDIFCFCHFFTLEIVILYLKFYYFMFYILD